MPQQRLMWTDGIHTIKEMGVQNQFCFFRNDGQVLGRVAMSDIILYPFARDFLYKEEGRTPQICLKGKTSDGKSIILTLSNEEKASGSLSSAVRPRPNFLKRLDLLFKEDLG